MNRIVGIWLLFLILSVAFRNLFPVAHFLLNQQYIAENLCVNLDKPQLTCSGKCVLTLELAESTAEETPSDQLPLQRLLEQWETLYVFSSKNLWQNVDNAEPVRQSFAAGHHYYASDYLTQIFHPPQG